MNTDRAQAAACCWALGAASVVAMNQNPRQVKRTARKLAKGAEHAVTQLDEMVSGFVERKMDL